MPDLSPEATELLKAASKGSGSIIRLPGRLEVDHKDFMGSDPRKNAFWESGFEELVKNGLIKDKSGKREIYDMTAEGYKVADLIKL
jgi:hypothetical protein